MFKNRLPVRRVLIAAMLAAALLVLPHTAFAAGGPYIVDDAEVIDAGTCQIETFARFGNSSDRSFSVVPSCVSSFAPWLEAGVGVSRDRDGGMWATAIEPVLKAALIPAGEALVGVGAAISLVYDRSESSVESYSFTGLFSADPVEHLRLNLNLGYERDRTGRDDFLTWGAGAALAASESLAFIAEAFGRDSGHTGLQAGIRPILFNGHLDFDLVAGRNISGERGNWVTFGSSVRF